MKKEIQIKAMLIDCVSQNGEFKAYNDVFRAGYRLALEEVLEIKRPKAQPQKLTAQIDD